MGDFPVSTNSVLSNPSSASASSVHVHLSGSIYEEDQENHNDEIDGGYADLVDDDISYHGDDSESQGDTDAPSPPYYDSTPAFEEFLPFHVLALYDFTEKDQEGILPFQKGDLFEIIQVQPSGWWGAQPIDESDGATSTSASKHQEKSEFEEDQTRTGWISCAFVNVVPAYLVQRLKDTPREHRVSAYNRAELFVGSLGGVDSLIQYLYC